MITTAQDLAEKLYYAQARVQPFRDRRTRTMEPRPYDEVPPMDRHRMEEVCREALLAMAKETMPASKSLSIPCHRLPGGRISAVMTESTHAELQRLLGAVEEELGVSVKLPITNN